MKNSNFLISFLLFFILISFIGCKEDSTTKVVQNNIHFTSYDTYYIDTAFVSNNYYPFDSWIHS